MEDLQSRVQLASQMLKATLEQCNLYIGLDTETEEFMFFDREAYNKGKAKYGRVKMNEINIMK